MKVDGSVRRAVSRQLLGRVAAVVFASGMMCINFSASAQSPTYKIVHALKDNDPPNPSGQPSQLVQDSDGYLYGTSDQGGESGHGTVFRLTTAGELTVLHSFSGGDGLEPAGGVIIASDGYLYGTTNDEYDFNAKTENYGTVFKLARDGSSFQTLHTFNQDDGANPRFPLTEAKDGNLYGVADGGDTGNGVIFKIGRDGSGFSVLHSFVFDHDAHEPSGPLIQASDGMLYGTSSLGGTNPPRASIDFGDGAVFKIGTDGQNYGVLYSFNSNNNGAEDPQGIVQGKDGNFYGITNAGGSFPNAGVIFKLTPGGEYTVLHELNGISEGGESFNSPLIQASDGNFYGTTEFGKGGVVFQITPAGEYDVLHTFRYNPDAYPVAALIQGRDGSFYGTVKDYNDPAANSSGAIFKLTLPRTKTAGLLNISTRLNVQRDQNVLIGGFIVAGSSDKSVYIRGLGPSLLNQGVNNVLTDPGLIVYGPPYGYPVYANSNWKDNQQPDIEATGIPPGENAESAMVATDYSVDKESLQEFFPLSPGNWTVKLEGEDGGTGVGLVEVYDLKTNVDAELANISTRVSSTLPMQ